MFHARVANSRLASPVTVDRTGYPIEDQIVVQKIGEGQTHADSSLALVTGRNARDLVEKMLSRTNEFLADATTMNLPQVNEN